MQHFGNLEDLQALKDDPDLQREMSAFMHICRAELLEYADEEELAEYDFNFRLATTTNDLEEVKSLGVPEETMNIDIRCNGESRRLQRLVFVSEVVFVDMPYV